MNRDNGLNILYIDTLDTMRIPRSELRLAGSPFHGVISGAQVHPLRQIDLPITFGNRANFRSEVLTFEVVDFPGSYHAILGQPYFAKFMAIPNYTYLKLKMPSQMVPSPCVASFRMPTHATVSITSLPLPSSTQPSSLSSENR